MFVVYIVRLGLINLKELKVPYNVAFSSGFFTCLSGVQIFTVQLNSQASARGRIH
jgi:hypothetical protein